MSQTKPDFPDRQWFIKEECTFEQAAEKIGEWEKKLREQFAEVPFTHTLGVPEDGTGGHSHEVGVYFCGEAGFVEEFIRGSILAFFWTGEKTPAHAHYAFLPRAFAFFSKKTKQEDPRSINRRTHLGY